MKDAILLFSGVILGAILTLIVNRSTIKYNNIIGFYNEIKTILIDTFQKLSWLDVDENTEACRIITASINKIDPLINALFFYIGKAKRKKISRHYNHYKDPYITDPEKTKEAIIINLNAKTTRRPACLFCEVDNAKEKAIKALHLLIKDFDFF